MIEPEWNISNDQQDSIILGLNNKDDLKETNESLRKETKSQYPEYNNRLCETDQK
jgi:hypothetical protein